MKQTGIKLRQIHNDHISLFV